MRIKRTLPIALTVVLIVAAVILAVQLRKHAPPEPARLLPAADAFVYADLGWIRKLNAGKELPAVSHDPEYEQFIKETGFQFERDLDEAAFAVHYPAKGQDPHSEPSPRFSEVFVGKFDGVKLAAWLRGQAKSVENYDSVNIFSILIENRILRVAILGADSVAASNVDEPAVIRGIVDRWRRLASPFGGPAVLRRFYKRVQFSSPVWIVAHIDPASPMFGGWDEFVPRPMDVVISAGYLPLHLQLHPGSLHVRAEALTASADDARALTDKANVFLTLSRNVGGASGTDPDVKAAFDSLQVKQENDRAVLNAAIPFAFLAKMLAPSASGSQPTELQSTKPQPRPAKSK
jgi:hypothetical protein